MDKRQAIGLRQFFTEIVFTGEARDIFLITWLPVLVLMILALNALYAYDYRQQILYPPVCEDLP